MVTILPPESLTLQFLPGMNGVLHFLQKRKPSGIGVLVFWLIILAMNTYLTALSSMPLRAAVFDISARADMRSSAMREAAFLVTRLLAIYSRSYDQGHKGFPDFLLLVPEIADGALGVVYPQEDEVVVEGLHRRIPIRF
ncbi:hypothetical protein SDC9_175565 [bioreactor metagenome]|uniref:Uncharacterized protein n=1 Tax=bioreactor metagenome TaxID=1076179 RepID=A0A645GPL3_9ZZZZ